MRMKLKSKKKKKKKYKILKVLVLLLISYFSFEYMTYSVLKSKLATSNEEFLNHMLRDSNHYLLYQKSEENVVSKIGKYFMDFDLQNPISLLNIGKDRQGCEDLRRNGQHHVGTSKHGYKVARGTTKNRRNDAIADFSDSKRAIGCPDVCHIKPSRQHCCRRS